MKIMRSILFLLFGHYKCEHAKWRPVAFPGGYGRHCEACGSTQDLSTEEFYAHFGFMPHRGF